MRISHTETGKIVIDRDEQLLARIQADPSLTGINVADMRICAESLATLYTVAEARKDPASIKRYALMKQLYLQTFSK